MDKKVILKEEISQLKLQIDTLLLNYNGGYDCISEVIRLSAKLDCLIENLENV